MRLGLLACVAALALSAACTSQTPPESAAPPATAGQPRAEPATGPDAERRTPSAETVVRYDGPLPPMPMPGYEAPRPPEMVRAVYEFAARRPDVLHYVPCFCGCERSAGHVGNDDCFVSSRDASGKPEWDAHGYG